MACAIKTLWPSPFQVAHTVPHRPMRWCLATEAHLPAEGLFLKRSASSEAIRTYSEASKLSCLHNNHQKLFVDCSKCIWKTTRLSLSGIIKLTHWSRHKIDTSSICQFLLQWGLIYTLLQRSTTKWGAFTDVAPQLHELTYPIAELSSMLLFRKLSKPEFEDQSMYRFFFA